MVQNPQNGANLMATTNYHNYLPLKSEIRPSFLINLSLFHDDGGDWKEIPVEKRGIGSGGLEVIEDVPEYVADDEEAPELVGEAPKDVGDTKTVRWMGFPLRRDAPRFPGAGEESVLMDLEASLILQNLGRNEVTSWLYKFFCVKLFLVHRVFVP